MKIYTNAEGRNKSSVDRKTFRDILGPNKGEFGHWSTRFNTEIEELVSESNIIGEIKSIRFPWLGYAERMGEELAFKKE